MTDDELEAIRGRMEDNYFKWHILTAQYDLQRLLAEVERLRAICGRLPETEGVNGDCNQTPDEASGKDHGPPQGSPQESRLG